MKGRSMLALAVLSLAFACEGTKLPTGPTVPADPSKIIRDGAHGGNKEFFFLPPMVPIPRNNPDFELGKFNNALRPSLRVEICELNTQYNAQHVQTLPTDATTCRVTKKTFAPGSVQLVNLPLRQNGWWTLLGLPADGFYYVMWDTRQSNLDVNKYYRIKVFVDGKADALGVADVDPLQNLRQWKYSLTGEVIQLIDNVMLPITFRVERGALCDGGNCNSATYTPGTTLELKVDPDGTGSVAGVLIPPGALPPVTATCPITMCPQTVVVNITEISAGVNGQGFAPASALCHPDLPLFQQFKGCFNYTTTPALHAFNEAGDQFTKDVLVAVCYELAGTGDPREKFAELYASGPGEPAHPLTDVPEGTLLGTLTKDCTPPIIGSRSSNPLMQFASTGWRAVKGGLSRAFGVKTAYGIDLGLGGLTKKFSNISPVLPASLVDYSSTSVTLGTGVTSTIARAKIVGNHSHSGEGILSGVNTVPVTFTIVGNNGTLTAAGSGTPVASVTVNTSTLTVTNGEIQTFIDGIASVTWTPPVAAGTYTMTATGPATGQVVFTAVVSPTTELPNPVIAFARTETATLGGVPNVLYTFGATNFAAYPAEMFVSRPDLPTCGGTVARRLVIDFYNASNDALIARACSYPGPPYLQSMGFALPVGQTAPDIYIKLVDRETGVTYRSNTIALVLPDLAISSGSPVLSPGLVTTAGGTVHFPMSFSNSGGKFTVSGGVRFSVYLSDDGIIDANDRRLSSASIAPGALEGGGSISFVDLQAPVPAGLAPGVYFLGVIVDDDTRVTESNENNNFVRQPLIIVTPDEANTVWQANERRMLSMQTAASYRVNVTPVSNSVAWVSSDPAKVSVTPGAGFAVLTAHVGGENIEAGADASVSSVYLGVPGVPGIGEVPGPSMLVNSFSFILFPRVTTLAWNPVEGAVAYHVVAEFGNGSDPIAPFCRTPATCTSWSISSSTFTTGLIHTFQFNGGQPGRWRVIPIAFNGEPMAPSAYVYFAYDPSS